jgi:glycosyltransferase involved in cell wall biosynthesis
MVAADDAAEYLGADKAVNRMAPLLSVRIITYNQERFIEQCVQSALAQKTDFPFEIVIGEDDSTDDTRNVCRLLAERHPDTIRLLLRSKKDRISILGVPSGRHNFAQTLKACRGEYVAMLDGDDFWIDPLKLQKQVTFLAHNPTYVLAIHDRCVIDADGKVLAKSDIKSLPRFEFTGQELKNIFWGLSSSVMCFRNVIREFPPEFYRVMNGDTFLGSLLGSHGMCKFLKEVEPSAYRLHSGSMFSSGDATRKLDFYINLSSNLADYYGRIGDFKTARHLNGVALALSRKRCPR